MKQLFRELKRRNVYKVAVTYVVVAFVGLQAVDLLIPATTLPAWADEFLIALAVFGFPVALVLAWAFEMTPEGVRRSSAPEEATGAAGPDAMAPEERRARSRLAARAIVGLGLVGAAVAGGWYLLGSGGDGPEVEDRTVAVLPFEVSGSGAEEWRDGMVTLLNTNLEGAAGLRAIADRTVFSAWQRTGRARDGASSRQALAVAREVGAEYAVVGSAVEVGGELRFVADVHETVTGDRLGQGVVRGSPDSVTALTDRLTRRVLEILLQESGEELPSVSLASVTTRSLPALKSYLAGERHLRAAEYEAALEDFEAAVELDSTFALAYARLGLSRWWSLTADVERERSAYRRALELGEKLPRRQRRLVRALHLSRDQGQDAAAADSLRVLTSDYPDDPTIWYNFGEVLFHGFVPRGWPEAEHAFVRAVDLDPGHALYYAHHAQLAIAVRHDSALAAERIASLPREDWREALRIPLGLVFGTPATQRDALARLDTIPLSDVRETGLVRTLWGPTGREALDTFTKELRKREGSAEQFPELPFGLVANSFLRGRVREGLSRLEAEKVPSIIESCLLAYLTSVGIPVPDSVAAAYLEPSSFGGDAAAPRLGCAAIYLIEQGREDEVDALVADIRETAEIAKGDTVPPDVQAAIDEVVGYRAWRAGELEEAVRRFSGSMPADGWSLGQLWRGDLNRRLGRLETAEGWYLAAWTHPVAHERLGQLYEQMGRPEDAAAAYRRFIAAWQDADPELQDRVEEARRRLQELTGSNE